MRSKGTVKRLSVLPLLLLLAAAGQRVSAQGLTITMKAPHIHAYTKATITFTVTGVQDGKGIQGLMPVLTMRKAGEDAVSEVTMGSGELQDAGNGAYTWTRTFPGVGVYALQFSVPVGSQFESRAFPLELTKPGGERIFKPSKEKAVYNYQIRWTAAPALPRLGEKATFDIELKRSVGKIPDVEQPWTSTFEHLLPANLEEGSLAVLLEAADGMLVQDLSPTLEYRGLGIYRATAALPKSMGMGMGMSMGAMDGDTYRLHVRFSDDAGYTVDETGSDYALAVGKPAADGGQGMAMGGGASGYAVEYLFDSGQPKKGTNELTVRIADGTGKPVEADEVTLVAEMDSASAMSTHSMSGAKPITVNLRKADGPQGAPGEYRTKIRFPYDGAWIVGLTFGVSGMEARVDSQLQVDKSATGSSEAVLAVLAGVVVLVLLGGIVRRLAARLKAGQEQEA